MKPATQDSPSDPIDALPTRPTSPPAGSDKRGASETASEPWGWTRRQRIGLGMLLTILLGLLAIQYVRRPYRLEDRPVIVNSQLVTLPTRIDPNTADERELSRVPHIGETMAAKIVQWRDARKATAPNGIVFRQPSDLDAIPGIGKKLITEIEPFLTFPDDAPATEP